jgi:hypothetical protein
MIAMDLKTKWIKINPNEASIDWNSFSSQCAEYCNEEIISTSRFNKPKTTLSNTI